MTSLYQQTTGCPERSMTCVRKRHSTWLDHPSPGRGRPGFREEGQEDQRDCELVTSRKRVSKNPVLCWSNPTKSLIRFSHRFDARRQDLLQEREQTTAPVCGSGGLHLFLTTTYKLWCLRKCSLVLSRFPESREFSGFNPTLCTRRAIPQPPGTRGHG